MASNAFGTVFRITTWGESHGKAVGVVIDGCPAGVEVSENDINQALAKRAPGKSPFTSPRKESDEAQILSGTFEGKTTGTPICILIPNRGADSSKYEPIKHLLRPGHAMATYLHKYGIYDYRGGGRSSARETATRVAAGAVAKKLLSAFDITPMAYLKAVGGIDACFELSDIETLSSQIAKSPLGCPDEQASQKWEERLTSVIENGNSLGGVVEGYVPMLPPGLGSPIYDKLEAKLASAMLSINGSRGFEIGEGFRAAEMTGASHNDLYETSTKTKTNHAGGVVAGISTGMPLVFRVPFKPTSSIKRAQATITPAGKKATLELQPGAAHDPCIAIRAVAVVEAMLSLVLADVLLMNRLSRVSL